MNKDAEAVKNFLIWLSQEPSWIVAAPSGKSFNCRKTESDGFGAADLQSVPDPLDSESVAVRQTRSSESSYFPVEEFSFFEPGETPAVQDRFHSLIKRRIRAELELKPPVFPWETEGYKYDSEQVPSWATQLKSLNLPVPMPEKVLAQLFSQCQSVMQSSLQEGAKLVRAVELLFPGQEVALNQLAGLVIASPVRSGAIASPLKNAPGANFPSNYDSATPPQQMALSLIAAREIIESLTLKVSPRNPVQRQWTLAAGILDLMAEYDVTMKRVRVQGQLPTAGKVDFRAQNSHTTAQRAGAGSFSLELFDLEPNQSYWLDVQLQEVDQPSMIFSICPVA
ncbi:MAG: hypothetical protein KME11_09540 [Timaviella obliquedivisa GSE-PSE-MK23-08B]|jgi:hypothetical protein|nr:hypothetical protein [Timaviella obliquedivisa GSE-PSE-MK23-08B]